ncbi:MAG TPA: M28 family peptidase [Acidobacteriota bacterium]|nr:M28 family peptidase [Acidobacteriota bacterium]
MGSSRMMDLIRQMEGQGDRARQEILMEELDARDWLFFLQSYVYAEEEGHNILVDVVQQGHPETVLLAAHYDRFSESPGANDDASACAILMDVADRLRGTVLHRNVRIAFFDDEEPTIDWSHPVGSTLYVNDFGTRGLYAVVNLELSGMGDAIGIWPVEGLENRPVLKAIASVLKECNVPHDYAKRVPGFYADYLPFREAGFPDAYCLTTFHWNERKQVAAYARTSRPMTGLRYMVWKTLRLKTVPTIFEHYHSTEDRSEFLSEDTLSMMSDLVYKIALRLAA